ncbi:MAG: hypothetical protein K0Q52_1419 [Microbacterium sp.]|nr:hypothetical protein [Microbacterium sp.]
MTSLRELDRVEDRIRQHLQAEKRPVLLVEGPDDLMALRQHVPESVIFPADGKVNVLRAMSTLSDWEIVGVRAVADADFDDNDDNPSLILYDFRDLEGMLIALGALNVLLENVGSAGKLESAGGSVPVVASLVEEAIPLARLRQASRRQAWGLQFDAVDLQSKTDTRSVIVDLDRYAAAVVQASDTTASIREARQAMDTEVLDARGPRGRDVVAIAGQALRAKLGTLHHAACKEDVLSPQLRLAAIMLVAESNWLARLRQAIQEANAELHEGGA